MDRTINFGDDEADARYRIQDTSSTGGDLVLAEDLDGGTVLLEYDYSASEWVSRGPVNLSGNDITNAGSISADTLEANTLNNLTLSDDPVSDYASPTLSFDQWRQPDGNYRELILVIQTETDGNGNGQVVLEIDKSGGQTVDLEVLVGFTNLSLGDGAFERETQTIPIIEGASYRLRNQFDPNNGNKIRNAVEVVY